MLFLVQTTDQLVVKERIAGNFISKDGIGRVILAGDAAHVHSVNGGQGLNTGVSDAFALAWRLSSLVTPSGLATRARQDILSSYDIERRGTAAQVIGVAAALVRDTIHTAKKYVSTIERNAGYITGQLYTLRHLSLDIDMYRYGCQL